MGQHKLSFLFVLFVMTATSTTWAEELPRKDPFRVGFGIESFRWKEIDTGGAQLLKESGERIVVSLGTDNLMQKSAKTVYGIKGRAYLGEVDYDGQTQSGIPAVSDVDYFGFSAEVMAGPRFHSGMTIDLIGALGMEYWIREIQNGRTITGQLAVGSEEDYITFYGRVGPGILFQGRSLQSYLLFGIKYPFFTFETVRLSELGFNSDTELKPKGQLSTFATLRIEPMNAEKKSHFSLNIFYDTFRFDRSDPEFVIGGGTLFSIVQPESEMDIFGAQLEYVF